ncbi:TonB-dependent receptor [Aureisphaera galaxeae]|uniref:TonB-dependent receptor plug domain-containing protein n=1 Tax=Aureisphaera galaxeae TaxID=1538023 RepID=UPI0023509D0F|nr:TonB-dependent receptor [Aureisphaera galaxeae]MDC8003689.1 TonB-dependent receptor [Aureisphaera galaxeae]
MKKHLFWALTLCASSFIVAQETQKVEQLDSVFIDTKVPLARKNSGKVVVSITAEDLKQQTGKSVAQIVNEVSGIEINGSRSNDGQNLGYFVRGGRNRQVVIMVDGVQLNDPSQISNDYDLRLVPATAVESIEIIKGASSVLYGSGAATAVISITTKKEAEKGISGDFTTSIATNAPADADERKLGQFVNHATINGTLGKFLYNASFSNRYTDGLSAVAAPEGEDAFEADIFNSFSTKVDLGYKITDAITIKRFFASDQFETEFDDFSYTDADYLGTTEQIRTGGTFRWKYNKGSLVINDSHSWIDREFASSFPSKSDAQTSTFDAYASYQVTSELTVLAGVNGNFSKFNSFSVPFGATDFIQNVDEETAKFDIIDPYVNATYISDFGLQVNAGARLNNHSNYGTHIVYNVNPSYGFDFGNNNLKVLGSYSTAYITPSLFQLYDPLYGNEELEPEENTTIEGGLEFTAGKDFRVSAVYFTRNETNFVDFVTVDPELFVFQYQNISDEFDTSGVEVEVSKQFGDWLKVAANYTNTQADDRFALRIPEHKANARVSYAPDNKTFINLSYLYTSDRDDSFFNSETFLSETVVLESFGLLNFTASRQFTDNVRVFAGVSNILDEEYEELYRFQTRGRNFQFGLNLSF